MYVSRNFWVAPQKLVLVDSTMDGCGFHCDEFSQRGLIPTAHGTNVAPRIQPEKERKISKLLRITYSEAHGLPDDCLLYSSGCAAWLRHSVHIYFWDYDKSNPTPN
jgi:hypothetical protein